MPGSTIVGDAWVAIHPDTSGFEQSLSSGMSGPLAALGKMLGPGGVVAVAIGAAFVSVGAAALDLGNKMNSALAMVQAQTGQTAAQVAAIGQAFLTTGGQTTFSAIAMAQAFAPVAEQLATVNGGALNASQSLTFMDAAMSLTEATGGSLAGTTAALAQVMQSYGITVANSAATSDILYNVSKNLNLPITDLAGAVDKLHAKLGPLSPSLADVSTLLEDVGTHGLTGSRALMLVTTGMNTLLGGTKPVSAELKILGINIYDANGKFVGMQSVLAQLTPKLADMTEQQRLLAEKTLFGSGASKALDDTIMAGLPGWDAAAKAVDKTGTAQAGANTATNTLGGAFDRLKSSVTDMLTTAGQPLADALKGWVNQLIAILPALGSVLAVILRLSPILIPVVAGFVAWKVAMLGMALFSFVDGIVSLGAAFVTFAGEEGFATAAAVAFDVALDANPISLIIMGIAALIAGLVLLALNFKQVSAFLGGPWGTAISIALAVLVPFIGIPMLIIGHWQQILSFFHDLPGHIMDGLKALPGLVLNFFIAIPGNIVKGLTQGLPAILGWFAGLAGKILGALASLAGILLTAAGKAIVGFVGGLVKALPTILKFFIELPFVIIGVMGYIAVFLVVQGVKAVVGLVTGLVQAAPTIWNWFTSLPGAILALLVTVGTWLVKTGVTLIGGLLGGIGTAAVAVWNWFKALPGTIWNIVIGAPGWLVKTGGSLIGGMLSGIGTAAVAVWKWFTSLPAEFVSHIPNPLTILFNVGSAIISGLWNGLKSIWNSVTGWIGGIGSWITSHKGPIEVDRLLLVPHGMAIMQGLNDGLKAGLTGVLATADGVAGAISGAIGTGSNLSLSASLTGTVPTSAPTSVTQHFHNNSGSTQEMQAIVQRENQKLITGLRSGRR